MHYIIIINYAFGLSTITGSNNRALDLDHVLTDERIIVRREMSSDLRKILIINYGFVSLVMSNSIVHSASGVRLEKNVSV